MKKYFSKNPTRPTTRSGMIILLTMIITGAVILIITLSLAFSSINVGSIASHQQYGYGVFVNLDACGEEALSRLNRDNIYAGETFVVGTTTCTMTLTGTDPNRTINITATNGDYIGKLQLGVTIFPTFTITSWQELST